MPKSAIFSLKNSFRPVLLAGLGWLPLAGLAQTITSFTPTTAAPGEKVTITGTGLSAVQSVMLNGLPMKVNSATGGISLEVVVPAAAATGRMRVTTNSGTALAGTKLGITRKSSATSYPQQSTTAVGTYTADGTYSTPTTGDLDKDGLLEVIVGQGDGTIRVFEQTAANQTTFSTSYLLRNADNTANLAVGATRSGTFYGTKYAKPVLTDLDSNGRLELLVGEETGTVLRYEQTTAGAITFNRVGVLLSNPYGVPTFNTTNSTYTANAGSYARPAVADFDNDGLLDVLVGGNDGTLRRYEQTAENGTAFTDLGQVKDNAGTVIDAGSVSKPLLTDYNGDGYIDMLLGNQAGNVVLYTQSGTNAVTFKSLSNLTTDGSTAMSMSGQGGFAAPAVTDIDGDGLLDLFVGNGNGTMYRFEQSQSATAPTLTAPLPVELVSFLGQATAAGNQLSWTTASELNSRYFAVERSADGREFGQVSQVEAAGNSSSTRKYAYLDAAAPAGTSYYRLRQVDQDGTVAYSPVVTLRRAATSQLVQAYPTVFGEELRVALPQLEAAQTATVELLTMTGRPAYAATLELGGTAQALPGLPALAPGLYVLRVTTAAGTSSCRVTRQ